MRSKPLFSISIILSIVSGDTDTIQNSFTKLKEISEKIHSKYDMIPLQVKDEKSILNIFKKSLPLIQDIEERLEKYDQIENVFYSIKKEHDEKYQKKNVENYFIKPWKKLKEINNQITFSYVNFKEFLRSKQNPTKNKIKYFLWSNKSEENLKMMHDLIITNKRTQSGIFFKLYHAMWYQVSIINLN